MLEEHGFELWGRLAMDHMAQEYGIVLFRLYHWIPQFDVVCAGETQFLFLFLAQSCLPNFLLWVVSLGQILSPLT